MHLEMPILAQQQTPSATLFQQLVFGENPGLLITTFYSFVIVATVFAGIVSSWRCSASGWGRKVGRATWQSASGPKRGGAVWVAAVARRMGSSC
jgi:hypothetical protein